MEELSEKDKQLYFQKIRKRMLRSKVKSLLEQEVSLYCGKHARRKQSLETMEQKLKIFNLEREEEILQKTNFMKRNFSFGKLPDKEILAESEANQTPKKRLTKIVQNLITSLTKEQLQEITEDPGYFFLSDKLSKYEFLRDPNFWKPREQKKQLKPITSDSRLLQSIKSATLDQSDYNFNFESIYQSLIEEKQQQMELKNQKKRQMFMENYSKVQESNQVNQERIISRYKQKVYQANQRLDQIKGQVERMKDQQRMEALQQAEQIRENLRKIREEQDLQYMNTILRRVCIEKQVKQNQIKAMREKLEKVRSLGKKIEKKEVKEDSEENY